MIDICFERPRLQSSCWGAVHLRSTSALLATTTALNGSIYMTQQSASRAQPVGEGAKCDLFECGPQIANPNDPNRTQSIESQRRSLYHCSYFDMCRSLTPLGDLRNRHLLVQQCNPWQTPIGHPTASRSQQQTPLDRRLPIAVCVGYSTKRWHVAATALWNEAHAAVAVFSSRGPTEQHSCVSSTQELQS